MLLKNKLYGKQQGDELPEVFSTKENRKSSTEKTKVKLEAETWE